MAQRGRTNASTSGSDFALVASGIGGLVLVIGGGWVCLQTAARLDGTPAPDTNPVGVIVALVDGSLKWSSTATVVAVALVVAVLAILTVPMVFAARSRKNRREVDWSAQHMARPRDLMHLQTRGVTKTAKRLDAPTGKPGVPIGRMVRGDALLNGSWEDMLLLIAGPRTQKTTAYAIPITLASPGAVLVTSNKRDLVDATRAPRAAVGRVWVFDPQRVANESATWWWNPLTYVAPHDHHTGKAKRDPRTGHVAASEARAEKLAGQFVNSARLPGAKLDAYFDKAAESLIGLLLLAAACGEYPLTQVYTWLTRPTDETPIDLVRDHGFPMQEGSLYAKAHLTDKQRDGVYEGALETMGFLRNRAITEWITPPASAMVPQFHPEDFAQSTDTLYPLSREGEGSAGPLVAALTVAVVDALEAYATDSPGGRLPVPFVAVLDEAANICRFRNLDSYYSHFGSRGIIMLTILQNWAQGEEVWGQKGMEKLWSAANIKVYGGGVDDPTFLRRISDLIGPYEQITKTQSVGRGSRSVSSGVQEKTILTVAELRAMPQGRAVLFASGAPSALIKPQPWYTGPDKDTIQASIDAHGPSRRREPVPAFNGSTAGLPGAGEPAARAYPGAATGSSWDVGPLND